MTLLANTLTAALLYFFFLSTPSTADIIPLNLRSNTRDMILFSEFEFTHDGYVFLLISSVTATSTSSRPDPSRIGFVLQTPEIRNQHRFEFQQLNNTNCPLDFDKNTILLTFQDLFHDPQSSFNKTYPVPYPGTYSLFFVNCNGESHVTIDGRAELYNSDDGTSRNYLSPSLRHYPFYFIFSSFIYLCFLAFWILACFKNKRSFHKAHLLMGVLLVMNMVQLICAALDIYYLKVEGISHGWDVAFYVFKFIRTELLFILIVLIFSGWCFLKPYLEVQDILVLIIVMVLEIWANVYSIYAWEAVEPCDVDAGDWGEYSACVDVVCCFIIVFPMAWSLTILKDKLKTDRIAAWNWGKMCIFAFVVLVYMIFTKVFVPISFIPWVKYGLEEISIFVLCLVMFCLYGPSDEDDVKKWSRCLEMAA